MFIKAGFKVSVVLSGYSPFKITTNQVEKVPAIRGCSKIR
jgi:hypothetical protein